MEPKSIKRVVAFDFDDTLAKTKSSIGVRLNENPDCTEDYLLQFGITFKSQKHGFWWVDSANYEKLESSCSDPIEKFDFDYTHTMDIDLRTVTEITFMVEKFRQAVIDPETLPVVVTARAGVITEFSPSKQEYVKCKNRPKILKFLQTRGIVIPEENLHTVGDTLGDTSEAKRNVLQSYLTRLKLSELVFYDDSERNIIAASKLQSSLPAGCRLSVYQVKGGECVLRHSYVGVKG